MYFPNCLNLRYIYYNRAAKTTPKDHISIKEILKFFKDIPNGLDNEPHLFFCPSDLQFDEIAKNAEYEYCINPELRKTFAWISRKILSTIGVDNYLSTNVYIRIGTSMLNDLVKRNVISKEFGIYYHDNLIANTNALLSVLNTEDLPF